MALLEHGFYVGLEAEVLVLVDAWATGNSHDLYTNYSPSGNIMHHVGKEAMWSGLWFAKITIHKTSQTQLINTQPGNQNF